MNWTGGSLHRHTKSNSNRVAKIQREHFAKARLRFQNGSISQALGGRFQKNRPVDNTFNSIFAREDSVNKELHLHGGKKSEELEDDAAQAKIDLDLPSSQASKINNYISANEGHAEEDLTKTTAQNTFESTKRNLLERTDWLGISAAKPLRVHFNHQKEMQKIGRHRKTEKEVQTIKMRAKDNMHEAHSRAPHRDSLSRGAHALNVADFTPIVEPEHKYFFDNKRTSHIHNSPGSDLSPSPGDGLTRSLSSKTNSHVAGRYRWPKRPQPDQDSEVKAISGGASTPLPKRRKLLTESSEYFERPTQLLRNVLDMEPNVLPIQYDDVSTNGIEKSIEYDLDDDWLHDSPDPNFISAMSQRAAASTARQLIHGIPRLDTNLSHAKRYHSSHVRENSSESEKWIKQAFADDYELVQGAFEFSETLTRPSKLSKHKSTTLLKDDDVTAHTMSSRGRSLLSNSAHRSGISTTGNLFQSPMNSLTQPIDSPTSVLRIDQEFDTGIFTPPHLTRARSVERTNNYRGNHIVDNSTRDRGVGSSAPVTIAKYPCPDPPGEKVFSTPLRHDELEPRARLKRFSSFEDMNICDRKPGPCYQLLETVSRSQRDTEMFPEDLSMSDRENSQITSVFQMVPVSDTMSPQYFKRSSTKSHYFSEILTDHDYGLMSNSSFKVPRMSGARDSEQNGSQSNLHSRTNKAYLYSDLRSSPSVLSEISPHFQPALTKHTQLTNPTWRSRQLHKSSVSIWSGVGQRPERQLLKIPSLPSDM